MQRLIGLKDRFNIAFDCNTDHERHGNITQRAGLLPPTHYLDSAIFYLLQNWPNWRRDAAVGKNMNKQPAVREPLQSDAKDDWILGEGV
jgi:phosphoglucomutase